MDAGGSWIDDELVYLNFVNSLLMVEGREKEKIKIKILAENSREAIYPSRSFQLQYDNYYQAIDEPFIATDNSTTLTFNIGDVKFSIISIGHLPLPEVNLSQLFTNFALAQKEVFGEFPFSYYDYIIFCNERTPYHGVEHANCTVITLPKGKSPEENLNSLLGISSHELFHAWNVCRIRPKELWPYQLQGPILFDTGYGLEGFTTYYGDLMLARSGAMDLDAYLAELNLRLAQYFQFDGRHYASLQSSSRALWANAHDKASLEKEVSIYGKGMIMSLIMDLHLRKNSKNQHSLDDIMKWLWSDFYLQNKPYSHADILHLMEKAGGKEAASLFQQLVGSTESIEEILAPQLSFFGLTLQANHPSNALIQNLGIVAKMEAEKLTVEKLINESQAKNHLMRGDIIVSINNQVPSEYKGDAAVKVEIMRGSRSLLLNWVENNMPFGTYYEISRLEDISDELRLNLRLWIGE
jgi:predicted metalloprotease with PDZ domain